MLSTPATESSREKEDPGPCVDAGRQQNSDGGNAKAKVADKTDGGDESDEHALDTNDHGGVEDGDTGSVDTQGADVNTGSEDTQGAVVHGDRVCVSGANSPDSTEDAECEGAEQSRDGLGEGGSIRITPSKNSRLQQRKRQPPKSGDNSGKTDYSIKQRDARAKQVRQGVGD